MILIHVKRYNQETVTCKKKDALENQERLFSTRGRNRTGTPEGTGF